MEILTCKEWWNNPFTQTPEDVSEEEFGIFEGNLNHFFV